MNLPWRRDRDDERHARPPIEQSSAEVVGRVLAIADALERLITDRERALKERDQHGR